MPYLQQGWYCAGGVNRKGYYGSDGKSCHISSMYEHVANLVSTPTSFTLVIHVVHTHVHKGLVCIK